jgi:hypothetical protein
MIEVAALATSLVSSFLVPLLKRGAEKLRDELADKTGDATAQGLVATAQKLWHRVKGKTEGTDEAEVVELFERKPELMQEPLKAVVVDLLNTDAAFRDEVSQLLEAEEGGTTRWQLMGEIVGAVDARGARIGDSAMVAGVVYNPAARKKSGERPDSGSSAR